MITVYSGMRLIDGSGAPAIGDAVLAVQDAHVVAAGQRGAVTLPSHAEHVDLSGKTVIPGLIDAHAHVGVVRGNTVSTAHYDAANVRAHLRRFAACGVLAVQIMGTDTELAFDLRREQGDAPVAEADLYTAGRGFGCPGGLPPLALGQGVHRPHTVEEARAQVRALAAQKPDVVKLWVDDNFGRMPKMKPEIARAVIAEAHAHGLRVAAHLFYLADAKMLVGAGLDMLGHSVRDCEIDAELLAAMREHGTLSIPTLTIDESRYIYADRPAYANDPFFTFAVGAAEHEYLNSDGYRAAILADPDTPKWRAAARISKRNATIVFEAGLPLALGSDSGASVERVIGFDSHKELELLVGAGFSAVQAIAAGSTMSALALGPRAAELGAIAPGKRANFLVLDADPGDDIRNTRAINSVVHNGVRLERAAPEASGAVIAARDLFDPAGGYARSICC